MKIDLKKINFKQPKYIFPLIVAVPLGCLLYLVADMISSFSSEEEKPTNFLNTDLPEPKLKEEKGKMQMMEDRYRIEDAFGAVDGFGVEMEDKESLDDDGNYSEDEAIKILAESSQGNEELVRQAEEAQNRIKELQRNYENQNRNRSSNTRDRSEYRAEEEYDPYKKIDEIQKRRNEELRAILNEPDLAEKERMEQNRIAREKAEKEARENPTLEVIKADNLSHVMFNTVSNEEKSNLDAPLIKAMIDQTTKSTDGTRLRFKLMDDVIIDDYKIKKGTYLYGNVSGFGQQRVKANISSILVGEKFLKVSLNVYDLDGMEGFYVPESSFRVFLQNAAAGVAGQSINFNQNSSSGNGINGEQIALQAIQNFYQSISSAISGNLRKNKAKIKYNTIVYLINTKNN